MLPEKNRPATAPDELIFRSCYAPIDLRELMVGEEAKERIRALPATQLYYGMQELDESEVQMLLQHVSGEQWRQVLDLALWKRDHMDIDRFMGWQSRLAEAAPDVAHRLLTAPDSELYELAFKRHLKIYARISEDEFEEMPAEAGEWLDTPDKDYRIILPSDPERARLMRGMLVALYRVDPVRARIFLESCRARTGNEIEETDYQESKRRMEEQGFQDYFTAIEVYAPLSIHSRLPVKKAAPREQPPPFPMRLSASAGNPWLLLRSLAIVADSEDISPFLEEISFVCNKVLSADGVSAAETGRVKQGIRKAISGVNLGLDCWAEGDLGRAVEGIRRHYLQSFFQIACGQLQEIRRRFMKEHHAGGVEPGSFEEAIWEGLNRRYPLFTVLIGGRIRRRFFFCRRDLEKSGVARS